MAITPKEAGKLNEEDFREVADLEKMIDTQLARDYNRGDNARWVVITNPNPAKLFSPSKRILDETLRRYSKAGWNITYHQGNSKDPIDTDNYYVFKPKCGGLSESD